MFGFKLGVSFIDDEQTASTANKFTVFMARFCGFKRANHFHRVHLRVKLSWGSVDESAPVDRLGGDRLSHVLRRSIIGAEDFHGGVRDGIRC